MGPDAQARPILSPSPRQSDQARWFRPTPVKAGLEPGWPVRTPAGRPRLVPGPGPGWLVPSPASGRQFRLSMEPDAQARPILSPQPPSVGSGVLPPSDSAKAGVVPGWGRSERQWAVRCTCRDWDPACWCRCPRVAVSSDHRWGRLLKPTPDVPAPLDSGYGQPFAGLGVLYRKPGWNHCNVPIGNGSPFGNLFRRGHFKKEETVEKVSRITRLYKRPQRSNENSTRGALLVRRCIVLFVPPAQPW